LQALGAEYELVATRGISVDAQVPPQRDALGLGQAKGSSELGRRAVVLGLEVHLPDRGGGHGFISCIAHRRSGLVLDEAHLDQQSLTVRSSSQVAIHWDLAGVSV